MHLTEEEQLLVLAKLRKLLNAENKLPAWANAMFVSSTGLEVWIDKLKASLSHLQLGALVQARDGHELALIPAEIDGIPIRIRFQGPGQAC